MKSAVVISSDAWSSAASAVSRDSGPSWASVAWKSNGGCAVTGGTVQEADGRGRRAHGGPCRPATGHPIDSPPMCGRFTQQQPTSEIARIFEAEDLFDDPGGRFNVAPTDEAAVVVQRDDQRAVVGYRWGLIPGWADDPRIASRSFNARAEIGRDEPAVPGRVPPATLPRPGRRVLRVAARRQGAPADADPRSGRPAARARRPVDGAPGPRVRHLAAHVHDRHHPPERVHGPDPRSDAGGRPARRLGHLARSRRGATRGSCARSSSPATTSASTPTRSRRWSTTSATTARS